jgi:hypothetical protein
MSFLQLFSLQPSALNPGPDYVGIGHRRGTADGGKEKDQRGGIGVLRLNEIERD